MRMQKSAMNILFLKEPRKKREITYQTITNRLAAIILFLLFYFSFSNFLSYFSLSLSLFSLCVLFDKYFMWENFDASLKHLIDKLWRMYGAQKRRWTKSAPTIFMNSNLQWIWNKRLCFVDLLRCGCWWWQR